MAVKLSSYYWFRNNHLVRSLEDPIVEGHDFGQRLEPQDRKTLTFIVEELDGLKEKSYFQNGKIDHEKNFANHVIIANLVELKDVTSDVELAAAYLNGIHKIMEKYNVNIELYSRLGKCFEELGVQPNPDTTGAIKYAQEQGKWSSQACYERIHWQFAKEQEEKKAELKKSNPLKFYNIYGYY